MTTFVTGGTSSIGRVLVKDMAKRGEPLRVLVRKNSDLRGLDLPGVTFVYGDVTDAEALQRGMAGCERVTHLAAIVGHNVLEAEWWRVNRDGARTVLETAQQAGAESLVLVSSISVLGYTRPGETADESRPVDTGAYQTLYQKTKRAADELGREAAAQGLNVKIVYPCFGYGCSRASSHPSLQDQTLLRMAAGKPVAILGAGKNRLCLSYYNDTIAGIRLAHERGKAGEDYILGGQNLTFPEVWAAVAELLGKRPPTRHIPLAVLRFIAAASRAITGKSAFPPDLFDMFSHNWCFSSAKAQRELGWQAHTFREGLAKTWAEYQQAGFPVK